MEAENERMEHSIGKKEGLLHGIYKFELLFKGNLIEILAREER